MKKKKDPAKPETDMDRIKLEIADEMGLGEKLRKEGWGGLTSKETGAIGARIGMRRKKKVAEIEAL